MSHTAPTQDSVTKPLLTARQYDLFSFLVKILLPAIGTFYFTMAEVWKLQYGAQVVASTTALALLLGLLVEFSKRSYEASGVKYDGQVLVNNDPEAERPFLLDFDQTVLNTAATQPELRLKFVDVTPGKTRVDGSSRE